MEPRLYMRSPRYYRNIGLQETGNKWQNLRHCHPMYT